MPALFWIIVATAAISLCALVGVFTLSLSNELTDKILLKLVALSSGALLGGAFLHLIPEGIEKMSGAPFFALVLTAILLYLVIEKILHWRHCHQGTDCHVHHTVGHMNLVGDSIHNFIDGLIIAAAFLASYPLGIFTTVAIALHEIPQEIGDFGVLLYAGFSKKRALSYNFLIALFVILGGITGWALSFYIDNIAKYLLPIAAGGFIYIAVSDLLPELRKDVSLKKFFANFLFILIGIAVMLAAKLLNV